MKKIQIASVLVTIGFLTLGFVAIFSTSGGVDADTEGDWTYTISSNYATITRYTGDGGEITIPSTLGEKVVTSIGYNAFRGCTGLTAITIPSSVTSISESAFSGCTGLTAITIPGSVTSIGHYAFMGCTGLTAITIPGSVTSIGNSAFSGCTGLTAITIPGSVTSIGNSAFSGCTGLTAISVSGGTSYKGISGVLFSFDEKIIIQYPTGKAGEYVIPSSVTSIGYNAFSGCTGLTAITIPSSVTSIGYNAFSGCTGLTAITIPSSVTSISESAFSGCTGLTAITIPGSVTSIGYYAFMGCTGLTAITIPGSVTSIGYYAFMGCINLMKAYVPDGLTVPNDVFPTTTTIERYSILVTPQDFAVIKGNTSTVSPYVSSGATLSLGEAPSWVSLSEGQLTVSPGTEVTPGDYSVTLTATKGEDTASTTMTVTVVSKLAFLSSPSSGVITEASP